MYDRILVPTDGSAGMARVIDHAGKLAEEHDAELRFLYVVNTASFANLPMETSWENVTELLRAEGETALSEAERRIDRPVETEIADGSPSRTIIEHAAETNCDLVVMGTSGRGGLNRLLLGSVAERVVRNSPIPVLTVRVGDVDRETPNEEIEPASADPAVSVE